MEMCKGLKEQIEYDCKGSKCLGEMSLVETEELIIAMTETAKDFVDENITCETIGSHGDLPPMSDDGRRAEGQDQHAIRHGSQPKPTSQSIGKWADIEDDIDEYGVGIRECGALGSVTSRRPKPPEWSRCRECGAL